MNDAKNITVNDVIDFLFRATKEERKSVSQTLSVLRDDDIQSARMEFRVGDKVKFNVKKRGWLRTIHGIIMQKNIKTFHVRPNDGSREWKVTASLVQRDDG